MALIDEAPGAVTQNMRYKFYIDGGLYTLTPLIHRLNERGRIPTGVFIERPTKFHFQFISNIDSVEFAISKRESESRLRGTSLIINYSLELSTILIVRSKIQGATLVYKTPSKNTAFIYGIVISNNLRGTWASAYLKYHSFVHLRDMGIDIAEFYSSTTNIHGMKQAKRLGAHLISEDAAFC